MDFNKVAVLESEFEAQMLGIELAKRGIPHVIKSYSDSVLDGLFRASHGWGQVEAEDERKEEVLALMEELQAVYEKHKDDAGAAGHPDQDD